MLVSHVDISFLLFFYKITATSPLEENVAAATTEASVFALDFGVKKQAGMSHLQAFDVIADV